jgi:hypothetical protein
VRQIVREKERRGSLGDERERERRGSLRDEREREKERKKG